jgi:hypothetical protein
MGEYDYGKRPLWQWILIYVVIGGVVYAGIYYFMFAKNSGGYNYGAQVPTTQTQTQMEPQTGSAPATSGTGY